jgi:membrane protein
MGIRDQVNRFDRFQQRHAVLAFPIAVWKKFGDDQGSNLVGLLAFYAFVSIFPLLLVVVTVLGIVLNGHPDLQQRVANSALVEFPIIGKQILANVHGLPASGIGLAVGIVGSLLGARGLANATQNAMNEMWAVPQYRRPGFPASWGRSYGLLGVMGLALLTTSIVSGIATWGGDSTGRVLSLVGATLLSLLLNIGFFWIGMCLATAKEVRPRQLWLGALIAACAWQVLQLLGTYIVSHQLRHSSELYGTFGVVLGLIAWLSLQAMVTLYAVEVDVVRAKRLVPRSLFPPPLTPEDRRAYESYMQAEQRSPEQPPNGDGRVVEEPADNAVEEATEPGGTRSSP